MTYSTRKPNAYTLTISSPVAAGLVSAISAAIAGNGCSIEELQQYDDDDTQRFFLRCVFATSDASRTADDILGPNWDATARRHEMSWTLRRTDRRQRVLLLVSHSDHCLRDLLYRWERKELSMDVVGVVSNHNTLESIARRYDLPYFHIPVTPDSKLQAENALRNVISRSAVDLVVLARYMQIFSDELSKELAGRCINIHHSFLPSFKGASPYAQAHNRGVKLIGATAHYVTGDLDEGPIIEQAVRRIDHRYAISEMQSLGRDVESVVLAEAVRLHLESRVFITGNKTVVFN